MSDRHATERERASDDDVKPEDQPGETGAEGGSGGSNKTKTPFAPSKEDDTPLGDTDQHSGDPA